MGWAGDLNSHTYLFCTIRFWPHDVMKSHPSGMKMRPLQKFRNIIEEITYIVAGGRRRDDDPFDFDEIEREETMTMMPRVSMKLMIDMLYVVQFSLSYHYEKKFIIGQASTRWFGFSPRFPLKLMK